MKFANDYGLIDRILHRLAFATGRLQRDFADSEDRALAGRTPNPPLFITGLPRAGTTLLLDRFAGLPDFASHTYRDMPFVLVPARWQRISAGFQQADKARERAHGDGMLVSTDSPEAFEEMLWLALAPDRYTGDCLQVWPDSLRTETRQFVANHMLKIADLRRPGRAGVRYVSKNNLNITRIAALANSFPDAHIVVPFRAPLAHAASLLRQHRNFLDLHARDAFAKAYMAGVGHFDFGANLKPVDFGGWLKTTPYRDARTLNFWLAYWIAAYGHLLDNHAERIILIGHSALRADAAGQLGRLAARLALADRQALIDQAAAIRPGDERIEATDAADPALLAAASALSARLEARAL